MSLETASDTTMEDLIVKYERVLELIALLNFSGHSKSAVSGYVSCYKMFEPVLKEDVLAKEEAIRYLRELVELFKVLEPVWEEVEAEYKKKVKTNA